MVATRRRPRSSRCWTAAPAPRRLSTSTYGIPDPSGRPPTTIGIRSRCSDAGSGSDPWSEMRRTPSTCPAARYRSTRASSGRPCGRRSTSCIDSSASASLIPRSTRGKNGSPNTCALGSGITTATESLRRVTRLRAARFGTYPSSRTAASTATREGSATRRSPFTTRDAVARETRAIPATCSSVTVPAVRVTLVIGVRALSRSFRDDRRSCQESALSAGRAVSRRLNGGRRRSSPSPTVLPSRSRRLNAAFPVLPPDA